MTNDDKLKPCPFCGTKAEFEYADRDDGMGRAQCTNPKCGVYIFDDLEAATMKWDKRTQDTQDTEAAQALVRASNELASLIDCHNARLKKQIKPTDLDEPDYMDMQTCHELLVIASDFMGEQDA